MALKNPPHSNQINVSQPIVDHNFGCMWWLLKELFCLLPVECNVECSTYRIFILFFLFLFFSAGAPKRTFSVLSSCHWTFSVLSSCHLTFSVLSSLDWHSVPELPGKKMEKITYYNFFALQWFKLSMHVEKW